jgi:5,10-methenyltetrahydromethanopterin hydrogenase
MNAPPDMVTVYRSMDATAEDDCQIIVELLTAEGLQPQILDDAAPGVPEGAYEVQVPAAQMQRAEQIIAENPLPDDVEAVDDSSDLDLSEPIFHSEGSTTAEFEATAIKNILEANGIAAMIVGDSVLPNLPFEVRVTAEQAPRAQEIIEEFRRSGPADAEAAELEGERTGDRHPETL